MSTFDFSWPIFFIHTPTVTSWLVADSIRSTIDQGGNIAEAMETLAARELVPYQWVGAERRFYPSFQALSERQQPTALPTAELLEVLSSHPQRIDDAERIVLGALRASGCEAQIAWVGVDREEPEEGMKCVLPQAAQSLAELGVRIFLLVYPQENAADQRVTAVLGVRNSLPEIQKSVCDEWTKRLLDPHTKVGFGVNDSEQWISFLNETLAPPAGSNSSLEGIDRFLASCLGTDDRNILFQSIGQTNWSVLWDGLSSFLGACLLETARIQKTLAQRSREAADSSEREDYLRWLEAHG